jgi:ketosteroid isomerase-like protein
VLTPTDLMTKLMGPDRFDFMSDGVVYRLPVSLWEGVGGAHRGKDAVRTMFAKVMKEFYDEPTIAPEIKYLVADETRATAAFVMNANTVWGEKYRNDYVITIECADGLIVSIDEMFDTKNTFDTLDNSKLG